MPTTGGRHNEAGPKEVVMYSTTRVFPRAIGYLFKTKLIIDGVEL